MVHQPQQPEQERLRNANSLICLDTPDRNNGTGLTQYACHDGTNQVWQSNYTGAPETWVFLNAYSGKAIDMPAGTTQAGVQVIQFDLGWRQNQYWQLDTSLYG